MRLSILAFLLPVSAFASALTGVPLGPSASGIVKTDLGQKMLSIVTYPPTIGVAGAVGDGVTDDSGAIQATINAAVYSNGMPRIVYIPGWISQTYTQTVYRCNVGLVIPTITNASYAVSIEQTRPLKIVGDGGSASVLSFPTLSGTNGLQYMIHNIAPENTTARMLSNFRLIDIGLWGPGATNISQEFGGTATDNPNVTADGLFLGFDPTFVANNTSGWNNSVENCFFVGWRNAIIVTNMVEFQVSGCIFKYNWNSCVWLAGVDTWTIGPARNIMLATTNNYGMGAIVNINQNPSNGGRGGLIMNNEIGGFQTAILDYGASISSYNGNFERNGAVCICSNFGNITCIRPNIIANTILTNGNNGGALFVFGDNVCSSESILSSIMVTGNITNTYWTTTSTNTYVCYDASTYRPPTIIGIPTTASANVFYGRFNNTANFIYSVPNPNSTWNSIGTATFNSSGTVAGSGIMNWGSDTGANTVTINTVHNFEIFAPGFASATYNKIALYANEAAAGVDIMGVNWDDKGNAQHNYLRLGDGTGSTYAELHSGRLYYGGSVGIESASGFISDQANKAALISSNITVSPYLWTNTFGYNVIVYISGAAGGSNSIAQNGTFIGYMTNGFTLIAQPNEYIWNTNGAGHPSFLIKPF